MSQPISVTRALVELKTTQKRIEKLCQQTTFASTKVKGRAYRDHVAETKANWQAITDLVQRHIALKFAIIQSNATTNVRLNNRDYTVAQAIAMKECLEMKRNVLMELRRCRQQVQSELDDHNRQTNRELNNVLQNFNMDFKSDEKNSIGSISQSYLDSHKIEVVDPIHIDRCIEQLDADIENFTQEVDFVLSESNALTMLNL